MPRISTIPMIPVTIGGVTVFAPDYAQGPGVREAVEREVADAELGDVSSSNLRYEIWRQNRRTEIRARSRARIPAPPMTARHSQLMEINQMTSNLPSLPNTDGFDAPDTGGRLIQGTLLRFGTDGKWRTGDGTDVAPGLRLVAMATTKAVQCWQDKKPTDTIVEVPGEPLPDVDELNSKIPREDWEVGPDGLPRAPWQLQRVLYLLNPADASKWTFASGTIGASIALSNLKERVSAMRRIRGEEVCAVVELASSPFKTRYGMKVRPELRVVDWCRFGTGKPAAAIADQTDGITKVEPVSAAEEMNDELPWLAQPAKVAAKK